MRPAPEKRLSFLTSPREHKKVILKYQTLNSVLYLNDFQGIPYIGWLC